MKRTAAACFGLLLMIAPAEGYHTEGHALATELALAALAGKMPEFFTAGREAIMHCSADPDYFKNPATPQLRDSEYPEQYTKWEILKAANLPATRYEFIDYCAAKGLKPRDVGFLPYAVAEWTGRLTLALAEHRKWPNDPGIQRKCLVYAGLLAHYAQDACQPLHTTADYDGRSRPDGSSPRSGVHNKIDALIVKAKTERNKDGAPAVPKDLKVAAYEQLMPAVFEQVRQSNALVAAIYEMEKDWPAVDAPLGENSKVAAFAAERLNACAAFTAALYLTAWRDSEKVQLPPWLVRDAKPTTTRAGRPQGD